MSARCWLFGHKPAAMSPAEIRAEGVAIAAGRWADVALVKCARCPRRFTTSEDMDGPRWPSLLFWAALAIFVSSILLCIWRHLA